MKRPLSDASPKEEDLLGSCMKRVKISVSPGELRLDRDLAELRSSNRMWQLERNHALKVVLHTQSSLSVHLDISRRYPHEKPTIRKIDHLDHRMANHDAVVNLLQQFEWSPILTISHVVEYILEKLESLENNGFLYVKHNSYHQQAGTKNLFSLDSEMMSCEGLDGEKHDILRPNRHFIGYNASQEVVQPMDGQMGI